MTGGTTTALAVTDAVQELVHAELATTRVYGVVALIGGVMIIEPEVPRRVFPGFRVHVSEFNIDHVRMVPLPLSTLFGLIEIVQDGGVTTTFAIDNNAKYEK